MTTRLTVADLDAMARASAEDPVLPRTDYSYEAEDAFRDGYEPQAAQCRLLISEVRASWEERDQISVALCEEEMACDTETRRRRFLQQCNVYVAWGLVGPSREPGVAVYNTDSRGIGHHARSVALYADHGGDREEAELAAIDAAVAADASTDQERQDGWLHEIVLERHALQDEVAALRERAEKAESARDEAQRTVRSLATMLEWENVPPRESLEANLRALKARLQETADALVSERSKQWDSAMEVMAQRDALQAIVDGYGCAGKGARMNAPPCVVCDGRTDRCYEVPCRECGACFDCMGRVPCSICAPPTGARP